MTTGSTWVSGLNEEQARAVMHSHGPLLILAGAGSGKTTVLVARTGRLIEEGHVLPEHMCVLTFTNKAARELKHRVSSRLGSEAQRVWAGTFHSFGLRFLKKYYAKLGIAQHFGVIDPSDAAGIIKDLLQDFRDVTKTTYKNETLLSKISRWREEGRTQAEHDDPYDAATEWLLPRYLKRLESLGVVDFDGLILKPIEILKNDPEIRRKTQDFFKFVMVDEFQDTSLMQMKLIDLIVSEHRNIAVVGDDDQSIYGWRGACMKNILHFPQRFDGCVVVKLEQNYRSASAILNVANAVIAKNSIRHGKILRPKKSKNGTEAKPELFIHENEDFEAESVVQDIIQLKSDGFQYRDIAVLYRSNSLGALFEAELRKKHIPYTISGGTAFFDRKEIRDVLAYLQCCLRSNEICLRRILNTPPRGIGDRTVELIETYRNAHKVRFIESLKHWRDAGVDEKSGQSIEQFFGYLEELPKLLLTPSPAGAHHITCGQKFLTFLKNIGYQSYVARLAGNPQAASAKWSYIEVFCSVLDRFMDQGGVNRKALEEFVESMELRDEEKKDEDAVQLMTLHACKGLEFPVVFLVGLEEDIIPHRLLGTDVSEERRLFYVGLTRAQQRLVMSYCKQRRRYGRWMESAPSRFIVEIPKELVRAYDGGRPVTEAQRKTLLTDFFKQYETSP